MKLFEIPAFGPTTRQTAFEALGIKLIENDGLGLLETVYPDLNNSFKQIRKSGRGQWAALMLKLGESLDLTTYKDILYPLITDSITYDNEAFRKKFDTKPENISLSDEVKKLNSKTLKSIYDAIKVKKLKQISYKNDGSVTIEGKVFHFNITYYKEGKEESVYDTYRSINIVRKMYISTLNKDNILMFGQK